MPRLLKFALNISWILLVFCGGARSQEWRYDFKHYTTSDGLPSSEVHDILSDRAGYLWFATDHGVCRYNGYEFTTFTTEDNSILLLYEDYLDRIWIVSFSGRLFIYDKGKIAPYRYNNKIIEHAPLVINDIFVDSAGGVSISSAPASFMKSFAIDSTGNVESFLRPVPGVELRSREVRKDEYFTFCTGYYFADGVRTYAPEVSTGNHAELTLSDFTVSLDLGGRVGRKAKCLRLKDQRLVFFFGTQLFEVSPDGARVVTSFKSEILDLVETKEGVIWVALLGDGLWELDHDFQVEAHYFAKITVTAISTDYQENLWLSTVEEGVFFLSNAPVKRFAMDNIVQTQKMNLIRQVGDPDEIWIGSHSAQLYRLNRNGRLISYEFPAISELSDIKLQENGVDYLIGGNSYTYGTFTSEIIKKGTCKFAFAKNKSGFIVKDGVIWSGVNDGIYRIYLDGRRFLKLGVRQFRVEALFRDHRGDVFVGNLFGLWRFQNGELIKYDSSQAALNKRVTDIAEFGSNLLCVGTRGQGLLLVATEKTLQLTTTDGLTSNNIRRIFIDHDKIWLATNKGVNRVNIVSLNPFLFSIETITAAEGLPSNEVNDILVVGDSVLFATNHGVTLLRESQYFKVRNEDPIRLYIENVRVNNRDLNSTDIAHLSYRDRNLSLTLAGLNYIPEGRVLYRYTMSDDSDGWVETNTRDLQFAELPYGHYKILMQAKRDKEPWTAAGSALIEVENRPPWWIRGWFRGLVIFLVLAFVGMLVYLRIRQVRNNERARSEIQRKIAALEVQALRAQMNPHFIFNALNSIQYYIAYNKKEEAQYYLTLFSKLVRAILDSSRSFFITLEDEIQLLKMYLDFEKIRFENKFEYEILVSDELSPLRMRLPNMMIQPFVENAVKHAFTNLDRPGRISVRFLKKNGSMLCEVEDNGKGRVSIKPGQEAAEKHEPVGTRIILEKIESLRSYYHYEISAEIIDLKNEDDSPAGTRVLLTIPENEPEL